MTEWHPAISITELDDEDMIGLKIEGRAVLIYRVDETYYASEDECPHARVRLSGGSFDGKTVTCPIHEAKFSIRSGAKLSGPKCRDLKIFKTKIEDGKVFVTF